jgi:fermentation-respiration switch protein FrsA (DUF1100 family)
MPLEEGAGRASVRLSFPIGNARSRVDACEGEAGATTEDGNRRWTGRTPNHELLEDDDKPRKPLSSIQAPTLVIHGTADPMFPLAHGRALASEIPSARLLPLEGLGTASSAWTGTSSRTRSQLTPPRAQTSRELPSSPQPASEATVWYASVAECNPNVTA